MIDYSFNEASFKKNFNVKEDKPDSVCRLIHTSDRCFKLFPYNTSNKNVSPIVYDLGDCISEFFRNALEITTEPVDYNQLCERLKENIDIKDDDIDMFNDIINSLFFKNGDFYAYNIGLYPYQTIVYNKSSERIAEFLYCVLGLDCIDKDNIKVAGEKYSFNVLERMIVDSIDTQSNEPKLKTEKYYQIITGIQKQFKADFAFMLSSGMTSVEDLTNLLSFYYFYYVSQTCLTLDQFGNGNRAQVQPLYFALDWEKVSKNRNCCEEGWSKLHNNISRMFSHAITLEIINQNKTEIEMMDYIDFKLAADSSDENDIRISDEIKKAERLYISCIGDCPKIKSLTNETGANRTDAAIRHLFECVNTQFINVRKEPYNRYSAKFEEFCKARFVKNRKKSGLTLNLTERDIIFLTKLAIQHDDKIRLNDLYKEYENRGIYLDFTSKGLLQDFFTKLNLIDKKSDSGDAQYVKRII